MCVVSKTRIADASLFRSEHTLTSNKALAKAAGACAECMLSASRQGCTECTACPVCTAYRLSWTGQELKDLNRQRCGTLIGTAMGGMTSFANAVEALEVAGEWGRGFGCWHDLEK